MTTAEQIDNTARKLRRFAYKFARENGCPLPAQKFDLKNFIPEAESIVRLVEAGCK